MVNLNKLAGVMREKGMTQDDMAVVLGMSKVSFNARMTGRRRFYIDEVQRIAAHLGLTDQDVAAIFFPGGLLTANRAT